MNQTSGSCKLTGVKQQPRSFQRINSNARKSNNTSNNEIKDQICDICAQNLPGVEREEIYAFGKCDHYVCYVCSARLRVLCEHFDCPICREKLDNVIFTTSKKQAYAQINVKNYLYNERYKIYYESKAIEEVFNKLLQYECQECLKGKKQEKTRKRKNNNIVKEEQTKDTSCQKSTRSDGAINSASSNERSSEVNSTSCSSKDKKKATNNVDLEKAVERIEEDAQGLLKTTDVTSTILPDVFALKNHLYYIHKLKLCDLCLTHNKLFPFEYSYYDQRSLFEHSRAGEPNTKHEGHPTCKLCKGVFFNYDELIQHMSREHYHCYLCSRHDYNMLIYFLDYSSLRKHFKSSHFLCELGDCRYEQLTSAFDSEIEYKMHLVQVHSTSSRGQQRTITLESESHRSREITSSHSLRQNLPSTAALVPVGNVATANNPRQPRSELLQNQLRQQRLPTRAEFPALGQNSTGIRINHVTTSASLPLSSNNFPSLTQASTRSSDSSNLSQRMAVEASSSRGSFVRTLGGGLRNAEQLNEQDFPPLPEQTKSKSKKRPKPAQQNSSSARISEANMTLDQLINASLTLSSNNSRFAKKGNTKGGQSKSSKSTKQKSIKIQIS